GTIAGHVTEVSGGGYASKSLTAASWATSPGTPTASVYPKQTFTLSGGPRGTPSVLGYYLTVADGTLIVIEPLAGSFTPAANGDAVEVTPQITLGSPAND